MTQSYIAEDDVDTSHEVHTSVLLRRIIDDAPAGHFTLEWLMTELPRHSFGFIILFLAIIALLPVISVAARIAIIILTGQIILGYHVPVLPERLMKRQLPTKYLKHLERRAIPTLQYLEYMVRPRWPIMLKARRFTAFIGMTSLILSLIAPIPLANMPPAAIGALLALSFIEHDGLVLFFALIASLGFTLLEGGIFLYPLL